MMASSYNYYESWPSDSQREKSREKERERERVRVSKNRNLNPLLSADIGDGLSLGCSG